MTNEQIKQLVEFYFGDINLTKDQFNRQLLQTNNNKIPLKQINDSFPKLKSLNATIEQIKEALKDSTVVKIDDEFNLQRIKPFDENADFSDQAVYVKGLPRGLYVDQINYFFSLFDVKPELLEFHKTLKNQSKGSFQLYLNCKEDQQKLLKAFGNQQEEDNRCEELFTFFKKVNLSKTGKDVLVQYQSLLIKNLVVIPLRNWKHDEQNDKQKETETLIKTYVKGLIIKLNNIGKIGLDEKNEAIKNFEAASQELKDQIVTRQLLQQIFQKYGEIKYIDFQMGNTDGYIRFKENSPDAAVQACLDNEKEPIFIGNNKIQIGVLKDEEEEKYWGNILQAGDRKWKGKNKFNNRRK